MPHPFDQVFPHAPKYRERYADKPGINLRTYLAAKAMQGLLASEVQDSPENIAAASVAVANALIEELNKRS